MHHQFARQLLKMSLEELGRKCRITCTGTAETPCLWLDDWIGKQGQKNPFQVYLIHQNNLFCALFLLRLLLFDGAVLLQRKSFHHAYLLIGATFRRALPLQRLSFDRLQDAEGAKNQSFP